MPRSVGLASCIPAEERPRYLSNGKVLLEVYDFHEGQYQCLDAQTDAVVHVRLTNIGPPDDKKKMWYPVVPAPDT